MTGSWSVTTESGAAADLHAASADALNAPGRGRLVRFLEADRPTLVLGSHQPESLFDAPALAAAGVPLARRRSGGGAVLVGPGHVLWVDLVITRGDPLWHDDVGRAAWWVGEAWARALAAVGVAGGEVWKGAVRATRWSPAICFAGLGPGEVTVGGAKAVGVSQRRTPGAALFQTAALLRWSPSDYVRLLADRPPGGGVPADLQSAATGLGTERRDGLVPALLSALVP